MAKKRREKQIESEWLAKKMEEAGLQPKDLAAKTGLDANWISQWKGGNRGMTDIGMLKIARYFGVSPYGMRPYLKDFEEFFQDSTVLDGLSEKSVAIVMNTIEHFRESDARTGAKPFRASEPTKIATKRRAGK